MSTTTYTCDHCGKERQQLTRFYRRAKHHFCDNSCHARWRNGAKDRAKDERIKELEAMLEEMAANSKRVIGHLERGLKDVERERNEYYMDRDKWKANAQEYSDKYLISDLRRARWKFAAIGSLILLVAVLCAAIWRDNTIPERYHLPTTKPDAGELVVCWQGESRTPHIAYVDSLGEWRDADNGEKLEVTKWSRP